MSLLPYSNYDESKFAEIEVILVQALDTEGRAVRISGLLLEHKILESHHEVQAVIRHVHRTLTVRVALTKFPSWKWASLAATASNNWEGIPDSLLIVITQDAHKMYAAKISLQVIEPEVAGYEEIFGEIVVNKQAVWKAQFNMTHWRLIENFFADSLKPSCSTDSACGLRIGQRAFAEAVRVAQWEAAQAKRKRITAFNAPHMEAVYFTATAMSNAADAAVEEQVFPEPPEYEETGPPTPAPAISPTPTPAVSPTPEPAAPVAAPTTRGRRRARSARALDRE